MGWDDPKSAAENAAPPNRRMSTITSSNRSLVSLTAIASLKLKYLNTSKRQSLFKTVSSLRSDALIFIRFFVRTSEKVKYSARIDIYGSTASFNPLIKFKFIVHISCMTHNSINNFMQKSIVDNNQFAVHIHRGVK